MDNKIIYIFLYDNLDNDTINFDKLLIEYKIDNKINYIPTGDNKIKLLLKYNKNNYYIHKFKDNMYYF